jgi:hypothetical protein
MSRMRTSLAGVAVLAAVALSACGGSGGGGGQTTPTSQPAAATSTQATTGQSTAIGTQTATGTQTASASQSGTTSQSGTGSANSGGAAVAGGGSSASQCTAASLSLSYLGGQGATGHGELGFALKNTGSSACSTGGYPGIQFLAKDGSALPTTPQHTTDDFFGHLPLAPLTLQPGQTASFRLGVSHGGGSSSGCTTAYGLQVIAPNDTATLRVQIPNGASECGTATVSPLQPGTSAFQ